MTMRIRVPTRLFWRKVEKALGPAILLSAGWTLFSFWSKIWTPAGLDGGWRGAVDLFWFLH